VIYPDTSFLIPIYIPEPHTSEAEHYLADTNEGLVFTPFHRLEFRTALRVRVFRNTLSHFDHRTAFRRCDEQLLSGLLKHTPLNWSDALREAERLGEAYVAETGVRSGDLLHVASAVVLGAREFVTFDQRQGVLARRAGLKVKTWKPAK
jgi:predicted nucleic acid-binding protein